MKKLIILRPLSPSLSPKEKERRLGAKLNCGNYHIGYRIVPYQAADSRSEKNESRSPKQPTNQNVQNNEYEKIDHLKAPSLMSPRPAHIAHDETHRQSKYYHGYLGGSKHMQIKMDPFIPKK